MRILRINKYQSQDFSQAHLSVLKLNDGRFAVRRSLPAGMDICPDIWRFATEDAATNKFGLCHVQLEAQGFKVTRSV